MTRTPAYYSLGKKCLICGRKLRNEVISMRCRDHLNKTRFPADRPPQKPHDPNRYTHFVAEGVSYGSAEPRSAPVSLPRPPWIPDTHETETGPQRAKNGGLDA